MERKDRSQCLVVRSGKILMAEHSQNGKVWRCLPGGAIEKNESPESAALRELFEECCVEGRIIKKVSEYPDPISGGYNHTFWIDIGNQKPVLGRDPELEGNQILTSIDWLFLSDICERDRAFLWSAGLLAIKEFVDELLSWDDDISYPTKKDV